MAQLLQHNQEKCVPCLTKGSDKAILEKVPLHGDQLFEERARNVIWTYRDGLNDYEQLQGIDTEFADWHAKYTLQLFRERLSNKSVRDNAERYYG